jgi:hypothetical protein
MDFYAEGTGRSWLPPPPSPFVFVQILVVHVSILSVPVQGSEGYVTSNFLCFILAPRHSLPRLVVQARSLDRSSRPFRMYL